MTSELKLGRQGRSSNASAKVVVAVKAWNEVPKIALVWALTHVVQPGDCITLLVVVPSQSSGWKWGFPRFAGGLCQWSPKISPRNKHLKHEELQCNIVVMKKWQPKVLRLNLVGSPKKEPEADCQLPCEVSRTSTSKKRVEKNEYLDSIRGPQVTPTNSPEVFTATEAGTSSVSSSDPSTFPCLIPEINKDMKKEQLLAEKYNCQLDALSSDSDSENMSTSSSSLRFQPWMNAL
uniref:Uncharacterized protein n=1 Tax=Daucus carota subsp. sativus TaxID=79200 RepID=A0A161ZQN8_DAUCS